jgi:hypothetical protein
MALSKYMVVFWGVYLCSLIREIALIIEAVCNSEALVSVYQTTWQHPRTVTFKFKNTNQFIQINVSWSRTLISSTNWWAGHVARMGEERKLYKVLLWNLEGKRSLGRPRCSWEDGIRMDLREIGLGGGVDWIRLAQDRDRWRAVVSAVVNLQVRAPRSQLVTSNIVK